MGLHVDKRELGPGLFTVKLSGVFDASLDPSSLSSGLHGSIVFDLDAVDRATSFGVREWLRALEALEPSSTYAFVNVRPALLSQFNMITGFGGRGTLVSLYVPFLCESCDEETEVWFDLRSRHEELLIWRDGTAPCRACGDPAQLDDLPEQYFAYVRRTPAPALPPSLAALVDGKVEIREPRLLVRKEIAHSVTAIWLEGAVGPKPRIKRALDGVEGCALLELSKVTSIDPQGFRAIYDRLRTSDVTGVYLARVHATALNALVESERSVVVATVVASVSCPACASLTQMEFDHHRLLELVSGAGGGVGCPACPSQCSLHDLRAVVASARSLFGSVPSRVSAYLSKRSPGYEFEKESEENESNGERCSDEFQILRRLASGGMAEVYLARKKGVEGFAKTIVLKKIRPDRVDDEVFVNMFLSEARAVSRLTHPGIVQVHDLGRRANELYMAMEFVDGWDARDLLSQLERARTRMHPGVVARIITDVSAGLHAAHTARDEFGRATPIIHRDISPRNILVGRDGRAKLTDFGIATMENGVSARRMIEESGGKAPIVGKIAYMSPEQILVEEHQANVESDVFALGVVLFELLTGFHPFARPNVEDTLRALVTGDIPPISSVIPHLSRSFASTVDRALAYRPEERFRSAGQLQMALERVLHELASPVTSAHVAEYLQTLMSGSAPPESHMPSAGVERPVASQPRVMPRVPPPPRVPLRSAPKGSVSSPPSGRPSVPIAASPPPPPMASKPPQAKPKLRTFPRVVEQNASARPPAPPAIPVASAPPAGESTLPRWVRSSAHEEETRVLNYEAVTAILDDPGLRQAIDAVRRERADRRSDPES